MRGIDKPNNQIGKPAAKGQYPHRDADDEEAAKHDGSNA
jgi:hypothetical protein